MGREIEKVVPLTEHLVPAPLQVLNVSQLASEGSLCFATFYKQTHPDLPKVTLLLILKYYALFISFL